MSFLVDTNLLSELAPVKKSAQGDLHSWILRHENELFLSVVTVAEIEHGIGLLRHKGASAKAGAIAEWLDAVLELYGERILPLDTPAARLAGRLLATAQAGGASPGFEDAAIAATAQCHNLVVATRNTRHFIPMGVAHVNPGT